MKKNVGVFLLLIMTLSGCVFSPGKTVVSINKKLSSNSASKKFSASVSNVQVQNNQLVITGVGLEDVSTIKVNGHSIEHTFSIESKSATQIIANSVSFLSFDVSKVFNIVLSNAEASATFAIDFSLCNSTLNAKGFDCTINPTDKDVLSYDQATGKWKPRSINGLNYQGGWDASTPEPNGATPGDYYIVSNAGAGYGVGDWAVWNGTTFDRINNTTTITSVFSRVGAVVATEGDYNLDQLLDVNLSVAPTNGKVLKFNGTHWVAGDDNSGGGTGSVTTTELVDGAVTDAKITSMAASKLTGTITSAQIADGTLVNADINAAAAIDYSKLNIPNTTIPYAKLNIADGDIPAAKITGLPSLTSVLSTSITDGDTTHAPDGNVVFDTLATKLNTTGGTLTIGTITGVPTPVNPSDVVNKSYTDTSISTSISTSAALKLNKSGDTMTGALTLDNDLKILGGTNYVTVKGHASSANYNFILPSTAGTSGYVLATDGSGNLSWTNPSTTSAGSGTVNSTAIVDGTITNVDINASAAIAQSKIANLTTDLAGKEASLTAGTTAQYYRGDKSWQTLNTTAVAEGTSLYFTNARVLGVDLAGLNTGVNGPITSTDTVLGAMGKLQYQVTDLKANGQWNKVVNDINYTAGNVGIGTTAPVYNFECSWRISSSRFKYCGLCIY